jgi:hypothetical protein
MLTIVQRCPAPGCDDEFRYVSTHAGFGSQMLGRCGGCGRKFRLVNGRPAEIDRSAPRRRRSTRPATRAQAASSTAEAS